jgi:3-hydroxyethyl bacteriochlorophyllide a dehydrogenase
VDTEAIVMSSAKAVGLAAIEIPDPGPGEVLVEAAFTCVSPGTELRCWAGRQPEPIPHPFVPGYSLSGTVIARGSECGPAPGSPVICKGTRAADVNLQWGGHVRHALVATADLVAVPSGLDPLTAAAVKLAAIAHHGARLSRPQMFERVLVVGLGPIGHASALVHAASGAEVLAVDLSPARVELVRERSVDARVLRGSLAATLADSARPGFDIVVDATGHPGAIDDLIAMAREHPWESASPPPRYVIQGSYADRLSLPPLAAFAKELCFLWPRDHQRRDIEAVISLVRRGKLDLSALTAQQRDPADAQRVYESLRGAKDEVLTAIFSWR